MTLQVNRKRLQRVKRRSFIRALLDPTKRRCILCSGTGERVVTADGGGHRIVGCRPCGGSGEVDAQ